MNRRQAMAILQNMTKNYVLVETFVKHMETAGGGEHIWELLGTKDGHLVRSHIREMFNNWYEELRSWHETIQLVAIENGYEGADRFPHTYHC